MLEIVACIEIDFAVFRLNDVFILSNLIYTNCFKMKAVAIRVKVEVPKVVAELQLHSLFMLHRSSLQKQNVTPAYLEIDEF